MSPVQKRADLAALLTTAVATALMLFRCRAIGLVGWDTYPEIASSRIQSVADLVATFTEKVALGYYPCDFYRPTLNLSLAADHALWGLAPFGFQISNALLYGACGYTLYRLARGLLGDRPSIGALTALVVFLLAVFQLEVVAIVSRRMDMIAGLFIALALVTQLRRRGRVMPRGALLPAAFTLLAVGAKEIAVITPPLVLLLIVLYGTEPPGRRRWKQAALAALPHLGAVALCFALRFAALGKLGGHPASRFAGAIELLPAMLGQEIVKLLAIPFGAGQLAEVATGYAGLLGAAGLLVFLLARPRSSALHGSRVAETMVLALAWLAATAALFGVVGFLQPWYLLVPLQGFALLVGAVAQTCADALQRRSTVLRAAASVALACIFGWIAWHGRLSPLLREPLHWNEATRVADQYLSRLAVEIEHTPDASILRYGWPPALLAAEPNPLGLRSVTALTSYSVQAWVDLVYPDRQLIVLPRNTAALPFTVSTRTTLIELDPRYRRSAKPADEAAGAQAQRTTLGPQAIRERLKEMRRTLEQQPPPQGYCN